MPKVNVTNAILGLDGEPIKTQSNDVEFCVECSKKLQAARESFTLRMACTRALTAITDQTMKLPGDEKFKRGELARKIYTEDEPHLTAEEISAVKKAIGEVESIVVVLSAYNMLDPQEEDS